MKKIMRVLCLFTISGIFLFAISGCSLNEGDLILNQEKQDEYTAYALVDVFWFLWNQNIAGHPTGAWDITVNGPLGGTVHIIGNNSIDQSNGINTLHLEMEMNECYGIKNDVYDMHFTGTIKADGTFNDESKAITYVSSSLSYYGTVGPEKYETEINETACQVNLSESFSMLSGVIDGRTFSWGD